MGISEATSRVKSKPNGKRVRKNISHPQLSINDFNDDQRWCAWRVDVRTNRDGTKKPTKVPYYQYRNDQDCRWASSDKPNTWITRDKAEACWRRMQRNDPDAVGGVGLFQGQLDNGYWLMGLDLDRCIDEKTGVVDAWAEEIIRRFDSYAEVSPSGTGVKVFFLIADDDKPAVDELLRDKKTGKTRYRKTFAAGEHRELAFDSKRYYAVTGDAINDASIQSVKIDDVRWFFQSAGPFYLQQHDAFHKGMDARGTSTTRDESGSGYGFRFLLKCKQEGKSYQEARMALLADDGDAGEWARRKEDRDIQRAWDAAEVNTDDTERPLTTRALERFKDRSIEWLWWPFVPLREVTVIYGEGGVGKSTLIIDMAQRIVAGSAWPKFGREEQEHAPKGSVLLMTKEDDPSSIIRQRLHAVGAGDEVFQNIHMVGHDDPDDPDQFDPLDRLDTQMQQLEDKVVEIGDVKLIAIDAGPDFTGKIDIYRDDQIRAFINPLARIARRHDLAVVIVLHINKKEDLTAARNRALGGVAFINAPRSAIAVGEDPDDEQRKIVVQDKKNLTREKLGAAFRLEGVRVAQSARPVPKIVWEEDWVTITADELMAPKKKITKLDRAKEFLRERLRDGPARHDDLVKSAHEMGIGKRTLMTAKADIGVKTTRKGDEAWWRIPKDAKCM
jgi:hypothetical protein